MELNWEYTTPHFSAHTTHDRRLTVHQMAVKWLSDCLSYLGDEIPLGSV